MNIATQDYLVHALHLNVYEQQAKGELERRISSHIIDMHSHLGLPEDAACMDAALYTNIISTYPHFTYEEHLQARRALWPQEIEMLQIAFCFPFRGINIRNGNMYVQTIAQHDSTFLPFFTGDPYDIAYTQKELRTGLWKGLKMYAEQLYRKAKNITDFFPHPVLETANELQIPIILHLPHSIVQDYPELLQLAARYPHLPFVVAHFGLARGDQDEIEKALRATGPYDNIFYDTSWFKDTRIFYSGLDILGPERILYATDQPFNLMRAQFVQHPVLGERIISDYPYHWADPQEQQYYKDITGLQTKTFLNFHYESLAALLDAIEAKYPQKENVKDVVDLIFYQNARKLLKLTASANEQTYLICEKNTSSQLPIPNIQLDNQISLRLHEEEHASAYYAAIDRDRPYLREWLPWLDDEKSVEDTITYIRATRSQYAQNQGFHCAIWYEDKIIGSIGYHNLDWVNRKVELGYWVGSAYQGKGIVTRACRVFITYAFEELGLNKVEIHCATGNKRSCAVAERLGFIREGVIRDGEWLYDHFVDRVVYGMRSSEWREKENA